MESIFDDDIPEFSVYVSLEFDVSYLYNAGWWSLTCRKLFWQLIEQCIRWEHRFIGEAVVARTGINLSESILRFGVKNDRIFTILVTTYSHPPDGNFVTTRELMGVRAYCGFRGWRRLYLLMLESPIVIEVKGWLSSSSFTSATFAVGARWDDPCLVSMAVPLVPPLFPKLEKNWPSFPLPGH